MLQFCSPEWIDALNDAVASNVALRESTADIALTIRQTVTDREDGDVSWHILVDHGTVQVHAGEGPEADVTFTQDDATARAVASGQMSAQAAFMLGRLRIGGDVAKLMEHAPAFDGLDDLFADVRRRTSY